MKPMSPTKESIEAIRMRATERRTLTSYEEVDRARRQTELDRAELLAEVDALTAEVERLRAIEAAARLVVDWWDTLNNYELPPGTIKALRAALEAK